MEVEWQRIAGGFDVDWESRAVPEAGRYGHLERDAGQGELLLEIERDKSLRVRGYRLSGEVEAVPERSAGGIRAGQREEEEHVVLGVLGVKGSLPARTA